MNIEISLEKSVDQNAAVYYELAKRAKKKMQGAKEALAVTQRKLDELQKQEAKFWDEEQQKQLLQERKRKQEWYEKFHWFFSSEGFLCIGGKDATSNELIIKKHTEKEDLVFHTDMAGSPFFVIKNGQKASEATLQEAAQATAVHSRAWKLQHTTIDVMYVKPEQVTKETKPGEYLEKGSFMIYGKTNYLYPKLEYALGIKDGIIIGGPISAVRKQTAEYVQVIPGDESKSDLAKKIKYKLRGGDVDEIIKFLPAGGGQIKKESH
ncbi:DUF814 domain-containing protein [Candidatus Woesearchaeota archaeon]|nr:DUF814 domain-containing protein [Candidatus Woesearchaeota archaeon]